MKYHHPLKDILSQARPYWDRGNMRAAVQQVFGKVSRDFQWLSLIPAQMFYCAR